MKWFKRLFGKQENDRDWKKKPVKKPTNDSDDRNSHGEVRNITKIAEDSIGEFGQDKRLHFLASIMATQNPAWHEFNHCPSNIICGALKALEIGVDKEYEDIGSQYRVGTRIENGAYVIVNELLDTKKHKLDEGDILADIAGIAISMYNQAIGGLILLENKKVDF